MSCSIVFLLCWTFYFPVKILLVRSTYRPKYFVSPLLSFREFLFPLRADKSHPWRNMEEYVRNMEEYDFGKYEEICRYPGSGTTILALGLEKNSKLFPHIGFGI